LRRRGVDVLTALEANRCSLSDLEQLEYATQNERVMVTFDDDLLNLASMGIKHSGIAFCPASKYSIGEMIYALLLVYEILEPEELSDHIEFL